MKTTEYLYDLDLEMLEKMTYFKAIRYKLNSADRLLKRLYGDDMLKVSEKDRIRIFHVHKAKDHCRMLLDEREEWQ